MTMWSMPKDVWESEAMQKYAKAPGSGAVEILVEEAAQAEGVTVVSEDGTGVATVGGEVVRTDMDEEMAYQPTKAFLENMDVYKAKTPFMAMQRSAKSRISQPPVCAVRTHSNTTRRRTRVGGSRLHRAGLREVFWAGSPRRLATLLDARS